MVNAVLCLFPGFYYYNGILTHFTETVFSDSDRQKMEIFLQEEGDSNGLVVIKDADNNGFTVKKKATEQQTSNFHIVLWPSADL